MYKIAFGVAAVAAVVAVADLQAPAGSRAAAEGALLLLVALVLVVVGAISWRRSTATCVACAERIKRAAVRCRHCGAEQPRR